MYDILFLSRTIPDNLNEEVRKKMSNTMDDAAIVWQKHIIEGIESCDLDMSVKMYNFLPIKSWPKHYKDAFIPETFFSHNNISSDINLSFCNIHFVKRLFQGKSLYKAVKRWAKDNENKKIIIAYSMYPEFMQAIKLAKNLNLNILSCVIALDLPEYAILTKKIDFMGDLYLKWSKKKTNGLIPYVDRWVLLTEKMKTRLGLSKPYCVIEGICSNELASINSYTGVNKKRIFYAGTLHKRFGILNLLNAFSLIQDYDYELIVCGFGDSEEEILSSTQKDSRIVFLGQLERKNVLPFMLQSSVIVNPRQNGEEFTKYSFPSKDMEALSSGIPFVGYKLEGIPDEYDQFINYPSTDSVIDLSKIIQNICEDKTGYYKQKAMAAQKWVFKTKSPKSQAQKLFNLLLDEVR